MLYIFFFLFRALGTQFAYREFAYRDAPKIRKTTLQNSYSETQNQPRPLQSLKSRKVRGPFSPRISLGLAFLIIFAHIEILTLKAEKAEAPKYAPKQYRTAELNGTAELNRILPTQQSTNTLSIPNRELGHGLFAKFVKRM